MFILECTRDDYWGPAFAIPLFSIVSICLITVVAFRNLFFSDHDLDQRRKLMCHVVSCMITLICLIGVHFPTFRHGIFLPIVQDDEPQSRQGYVTAITEVPLSPRYSISNGTETYRASLVQIDGDEFYFLSAEGLEVGQEIVISYLPQCSMVLTCQIIEKSVDTYV